MDFCTMFILRIFFCYQIFPPSFLLPSHASIQRICYMEHLPFHCLLAYPFNMRCFSISLTHIHTQNYNIYCRFFYTTPSIFNLSITTTWKKCFLCDVKHSVFLRIYYTLLGSPLSMLRQVCYLWFFTILSNFLYINSWLKSWLFPKAKQLKLEILDLIE